MTSKFNLSLDDFAPFVNSGLNFEAIDWCDRLIEDYPDLKVNLFVPAAYCRLGGPPCYLSDHPKWVERVNALSKKNYRVNLHGLHHRRSSGDHAFHRPHSQSNNDEWQHLDVAQADRLFNMMRAEFDKAGLDYGKSPMVFRPPGWSISKGAIQVLAKNNVVVAGDEKYSKNNVSGARWLNYNWEMIERCDLPGDVWAAGHTSNWTPNYMNAERYAMVMELLRSRNFSFEFLGE